MEGQERREKERRLVSLHGKFGYGLAGVVFLVLVVMIISNILLIHDMTVEQTETVGYNQMQGITRDLQAMLSESEYMVSVLASNVE